ncbi:MAG: arylesterase [Alphaproteobacteria bacterium]|nr:arylesterase [Alphaproteobacteria bacterium]MBU0792758.1 arylesterase [Alphaproteobacteria bacterium]MBU0876531.1 arylesterase [Alphaproteobacteria bacterium]MBU1769232.1 arylesterase [Alphaproteobacteria bacterium]
MRKGPRVAKDFYRYGVSLALGQALLACSPQSSDNQAQPAPVANTAQNAANAAAPVADRKLVLVFGDSLYAGYNLGAREGFAPVLERALEGQGVPAEVINAGVSGDTTAAGRQRLAFTLDGLERKPDLVIVGLGGNDMLRGLEPKETRANLDAILAELQKRGIPALLTGMVSAPNMGTDYASAFNPIFTDLAKKYDAPLYPFFLDGVIGDRTLMLPDGIHPNPQGVEKIVGRVGPLVAETLKGEGE